MNDTPERAGEVASCRGVDEVDHAIGETLRTLRRQRGMSLQALGDVMGLSYQQVQKYELGRNRLSARNLYVLAHFFEVDITAFFDRMTTEPPAPEIASIAAKLQRIAQQRPEAAQELFALVGALAPPEEINPR